ncbi:hypothetical protein PtrSN002B_004706 [Pyrenophora tritici-repentis]|uniref:Uncharacterized protein n=2 Tax=Pyrenophora tritici-repentis TaxID=45151 RepID=A0A2W1EGE0_9PLEO|nr:uncharacterized protein PTRG_07992 [Pyrenophora tritici-repentis Pt-1C-BFP]KAA8616667.1 hypothetical protein PtrV1_09968 [Pyrenophora tritici-repentis]EDU50911.1 predicted protein [Pyrenophora tritici-repentis Pt-1C-BFP]KAF7445962.1 hypothetical protein A1F99_092530 [Pyrenophora tritici-repentis]KAF7567059.1 hypothetical protein PtrM4_136500 [Pyrenophora tritici-repentis]KAG9381669.1 hypothetical protein A1F94_007323 [Pyrenophora tritici-repentis]
MAKYTNTVLQLGTWVGAEIGTAADTTSTTVLNTVARLNPFVQAMTNAITRHGMDSYSRIEDLANESLQAWQALDANI